MSRTIINIGNGVSMVSSEPGDMTRYDFFIYNDGNGLYNFMPRKSTFRFPQSISYWDVKDLFKGGESRTEIMEIFNNFINSNTEYKDINPWTLLECINTLNEIEEGVDNE